MNRRQLIEMLNRAKSEAASNTSEAGPSVPSTPVRFDLKLKPHIFFMVYHDSIQFQFFQGKETFPRGAGRAKLFRPELLNKLTLNSSGEESSTADSLSDNHSTVSAESEETKKIDKAGSTGRLVFDFVVRFHLA